ncbi:VanZ family protein [Ruminococcus sp.]|uniref:VanZ family protein n=1 Tax=Ruminococcus sp. TaxID=41978 RepID=UPI00388D7AED
MFVKYIRWSLYLLYLTIKKELEYYLPNVNLFEALICFALFVILLMVTERVFRKKISVVYIIVSALYYTFLISITVLGRSGGSKSDISTLFITYKNAFLNDQINLTDIVFNMALFIPVGLLISRYKKNVFCVTVLLLTPVIIEFTQLFTGRGVFEISDIINNFVGGLIGLLLARLIAKAVEIMKKKRKDKQVERTE